MLSILEKVGLLHGKDQGSMRLAEAGGSKTPTRAELIALDRRRQGKKGSNNDWQPTTDEAARRAKLNEGRTHMAYKPVHVVDLESGAIVSAVIHPAEQGDTQHWPPRLTMRRPNCARSGAGKEHLALTIPLIRWWTRAFTAVACCRHCLVPAAAGSMKRRTGTVAG